jgi:hypothetical protein
VTGRGSKKSDWEYEKTQNTLLADAIKEERLGMDNKFVYTKEQMTLILLL